MRFAGGGSAPALKMHLLLLQRIQMSSQRLRTASWAQASPSTSSLQLSPAVQRERTMLAAASKEQRDAEEAALRHRNAELSAMVKTASTRIDTDLSDEPVWAYRTELADASRERHDERAAEQRAANAEMRARLAQTFAHEDDDITDEAAWMMRERLAEESNERRLLAAEEQRLANVEMASRLAQVHTKTDDDIDDEEAGKARKLLAAASEVRREEEKRALAAANADIAARLKKGAITRTDDDIDDEEAGKARKLLAAEAERRRSVERRALSRRNAEMASRLRGVGSHVNSDESTHSMRWGRSQRVWEEKYMQPERERLAKLAEEKAARAKLRRLEAIREQQRLAALESIEERRRKEAAAMKLLEEMEKRREEEARLNRLVDGVPGRPTPRPAWHKVVHPKSPVVTHPRTHLQPAPKNSPRGVEEAIGKKEEKAAARKVLTPAERNYRALVAARYG